MYFTLEASCIQLSNRFHALPDYFHASPNRFHTLLDHFHDLLSLAMILCREKVARMATCVTWLPSK